MKILCAAHSSSPGFVHFSSWALSKVPSLTLGWKKKMEVEKCKKGFAFSDCELHATFLSLDVRRNGTDIH